MSIQDLLIQKPMNEEGNISTSQAHSTQLWNKDRKITMNIPVQRGERTSLVVQWLRHHFPNAGVLGSIPNQEIKSHKPHSAAPQKVDLD